MKILPLNLIRHFFLSLLLAVLFGSAGAQTTALTAGPGNISFRYAGMQDEHLVFYVHVENESKERIKFLVRDENKNVLFEESFTNSTFEKKVLLVKGEISNVRFELNARNYSYSRDFSISTRTIEEITVSEKTK